MSTSPHTPFPPANPWRSMASVLDRADTYRGFQQPFDQPQLGSLSRLRSPAEPWSALVVLQWMFIWLGWILFGWAWLSVMRYTTWETIVGTVVLLVVVVTITVAIKLYWIVHNVGIYRKKGPRKKIPDVEYEFYRDFLNRELIADWNRVSKDQLIIVTVDGEYKTFASYRGNFASHRGKPSLKKGKTNCLRLKTTASPWKQRDAVERS